MNKIIDFHTHPFINEGQNICTYRSDVGVSFEDTPKYMKDLGVTTVCGSIINNFTIENMTWSDVEALNNEALKLAEIWRGFYVPGFHVHPHYLKESLAEIERMHKLGVNLIGELIPYGFGWTDYASKAMDEILDLALQYNMIFNFHTMYEDTVDKMVEKHPNNIIVAAHPGEYPDFMGHLERMKKSENYYLDLSGTGVFRQGMLAYGIKKFGAERFLYGSDFPVCNPAVFVGGVGLDSLVSDADKEKVFYTNADALLKRTDNSFYENAE
ncbi:MAG: amidohydrolase [Clostridia bacterium]|nr:amidohydrolase [Clostridia bacterium]